MAGCPAGEIKRDAYDFTNKHGTKVHVPASCVPDKGAPGKTSGPKKWADVHLGNLHGWKKEMPAEKRRKILRGLVKKDDYATIIRRLNQLANLTTDEDTHDKARADMAYLKREYRYSSPGGSKKKYIVGGLVAAGALLAFIYIRKRQ